MEVIVAIVNPVGVEIFVTCKYAEVPGISYNGGYADYVIAPMEALASIPEQLSPVETAPLMCAGITTYNALRNSGARVGDTVAIFGMGGLGHLGIQFAAKMGFNTVAIGRDRDKEEELMKNLGARHYMDNRSQNVVEELNKLGGAKVILATVPSGKAMTEILGGLAVNG
jgi:D-arabinose 1-dehydrogenase-like Zn-dependent alcohol dehydrogenase